MNIQYQDLHKLVSDLRYILQTGGNPLLEGGGGHFWDRFMYMNSVLKSVLMFVVLVIAFYVLYILVFRGYPKILFDLATLSFYKKEDVDKFLGNRSFMFKHYKQLFKTDWNTWNPHEALAEIYGYSSQLYEKAKRVEDLVQQHYGKLRYDDRLREMFREFYLFYNRVNIDRRKDVYSWIEYSLRNPGAAIPMMNSPEAAAGGKVRMTPKTIETPTVIHYTDFYETMVEYKKKAGLLTEKDLKLPYDNQRRKNDEELMIEMYVKDRIAFERGSTSYEYKRVKDLNLALRELAIECNVMVQRVRDIPITMYLLLPTSPAVVQQFKLDFDSRKELVRNGKIYDDKVVRFKDVNEYSWFMFEVLQYAQNDQRVNKYNEFKGLIEGIFAKAGAPSGSIRTQLYQALIGYMNLPYDQRIKAESKLVLSYPGLKKYFTRELLSFINKHPIFTRVYLSWMVETTALDRTVLYEKIMNAYTVLMRKNFEQPNVSTADEAGMVMNLMKNGDSLQMLINAGNIMDLYLTDYRVQLTKLYEEHYISNQQFFMALWKPYVHEIWTERIMERFKRTFSWGNIRKSWYRFRYKVWGYGFFGNPKSGLGKILYDLSDIIWKMFTSKPPPQPVEEPAPDMTGPSADELGGFGF